MALDRYSKIVLTVIAVALVAIAVRPWFPASTWLDPVSPAPALAQAPGVPKDEVALPKPWGNFVAFSNGNVLLEAPDGSWRIVDVEGRPPEHPKIKTLVRWQ